MSALLTTDAPESVELNFRTIFKDEPNDLGWYVEESVEARGGILTSGGVLRHGACFTEDDVDDCST